MTTQPELTEKIPTWRFNLACIGFARRPFRRRSPAAGGC